VSTAADSGSLGALGLEDGRGAPGARCGAGPRERGGGGAPRGGGACGGGAQRLHRWGPPARQRGRRGRGGRRGAGSGARGEGGRRAGASRAPWRPPATAQSSDEGLARDFGELFYFFPFRFLDGDFLFFRNGRRRMGNRRRTAAWARPGVLDGLSSVYEWVHFWAGLGRFFSPLHSRSSP
jgi:hypothetical protein